MFLKLIKIWNTVRKPFLIIPTVIILFLFGVYIFSQTRIAGDAASHLILAVSPILKIGSPYKDFWDIKPPFLPLTLYLWSNLFGFGILSIRIFNILVAGVVIFICNRIYKKVFPTPVFEMIFLYTIIIVLSPILNSVMIPTEILGLLLSLGALLVLIGVRKEFPKFYFSGFLFFAASQTKEPFTFTVLAMAPLFFESFLQNGLRKAFKNFMQFLSGTLTCLAGIYFYLASFNAVKAYTEIFKYKQMFFPFSFEKISQNFLPGFYSAERTFTEFSHGFSILLIFVLLSFYLVNKFKKTLSFNLHSSQLTTKPIVVTDPGKIQKYTVLFYAIGSFLGFGLGGSFGSHYLIQVVVPFYIIFGLMASYLYASVLYLFHKSKLYFCIVLLLFFFSALIMMPKRPYVSSYLRYLRGVTNFSFTDQVWGFERRITELATKDQCILSVYGWGAGENYLYSMRRPCTRFFLVNIVWEDWQKKEYVNAIITNPPAVIYYRTAGADMDWHKFETEVINISKIMENCYVPDTKEEVLFVPKIKNTEQLRNCIKASVI